MKTLKNNYALYALIIGLLLTFSHTARAQDVPDNFDPNANNTVRSIVVQTDGKILIGGDFTTLNPNGSGTVTRNRIARLGFAEIADSDGDGILDDMDNCPMTSNPDQADNDMDMIGNACDDDDDNDGVLDVNDAFPFDPNESVDTDGDGIGNNADTDDDNDGQSDADETACGSDPLDAGSTSPDADGDNIPDCVDTDDDNDGIPDTCDIDQNPGAEDFDRDGTVDSSECDTVIGPPTDKDQCKNNGYKRFNNPTFRNQGQCVSFVQSNRPQ